VYCRVRQRLVCPSASCRRSFRQEKIASLQTRFGNIKSEFAKCTTPNSLPRPVPKPPHRSNRSRTPPFRCSFVPRLVLRKKTKATADRGLNLLYLPRPPCKISKSPHQRHLDNPLYLRFQARIDHCLLSSTGSTCSRITSLRIKRSCPNR
jgi:hypothetical protein